MTIEDLLALGVTKEEDAMKILELFSKEGEKKSLLEERLGAVEGEREQLVSDYENRLKTMAVEMAIQELGGKNKKAIFPFIDMEQVSLDEEGTLAGLDLEKIKAEVPFLFQETEKSVRGTGIPAVAKQKQKSDTAKKFRDALLRK